MAGNYWLLNFKKRNPKLPLRKPAVCSLTGAIAFIRKNGGRLYNNFENLMGRSFPFAEGTSICILDETSKAMIQKPRKVIAPKGCKNIGKITSGERGTVVNACCIIRVSRVALPPVIVSKGKISGIA